MAVQYESVSSAGFTAETTSITITKPTGLSVGDLMLAHIGYGNQVAGANTPTNWTYVTDRLISSGGLEWRSYVFYKIADSSDVSASNFTFTIQNGGYIAGAIYRISGTDTSNPVSAFNSTSGSGVVSGAAITPTADNILIMLVGTTGGSASPGVSNYAIANSNPTWTERYDLATGSVENFQFAGASSSVRTQNTDTGNASVSIASIGTGFSMIQLLGIQPPQIVGPTNVKTFDGVTQSSGIKTYMGIATASVKSVNGVS